MALIRRRDMNDPFDILSSVQNELNRAFNRSFWRPSKEWSSTFQPDVDVSDEGDHYHLQADLPGLKKDNLNITAQGNRLILSGERKEEHEHKEKDYQYSERAYGAFSRALDFPMDIQGDKVKATYKDGVLDMDIPKSEASKPKQIQVDVKS